MGFAPGNRLGGRKNPTLAKTRALIVLNDFAEEAAKILAQIARTGTKSEQMKAIELALAYGIGRPTQAVELTGKDGKDLIPSVSVSIKTPESK